MIELKKRGRGDGEIASYINSLKEPLTIEELADMHDQPDMEYHYNQAIARLALQAGHKIKFELERPSSLESVLLDIMNQTFLNIRDFK